MACEHVWDEHDFCKFCGMPADTAFQEYVLGRTLSYKEKRHCPHVRPSIRAEQEGAPPVEKAQLGDVKYIVREGYFATACRKIGTPWYIYESMDA